MNSEQKNNSLGNFQKIRKKLKKNDEIKKQINNQEQNQINGSQRIQNENLEQSQINNDKLINLEQSQTINEQLLHKMNKINKQVSDLQNAQKQQQIYQASQLTQKISNNNIILNNYINSPNLTNKIIINEINQYEKQKFQCKDIAMAAYQIFGLINKINLQIFYKKDQKNQNQKIQKQQIYNKNDSLPQQIIQFLSKSNKYSKQTIQFYQSMFDPEVGIVLPFHLRTQKRTILSSIKEIINQSEEQNYFSFNLNKAVTLQVFRLIKNSSFQQFMYGEGGIGKTTSIIFYCYLKYLIECYQNNYDQIIAQDLTRVIYLSYEYRQQQINLTNFMIDILESNCPGKLGKEIRKQKQIIMTKLTRQNRQNNFYRIYYIISQHYRQKQLKFKVVLDQFNSFVSKYRQLKQLKNIEKSNVKKSKDNQQKIIKLQQILKFNYKIWIQYIPNPQQTIFSASINIQKQLVLEIEKQYFCNFYSNQSDITYRQIYYSNKWIYASKVNFQKQMMRGIFFQLKRINPKSCIVDIIKTIENKIISNFVHSQIYNKLKQLNFNQLIIRQAFENIHEQYVYQRNIQQQQQQYANNQQQQTNNTQQLLNNQFQQQRDNNQLKQQRDNDQVQQYSNIYTKQQINNELQYQQNQIQRIQNNKQKEINYQCIINNLKSYDENINNHQQITLNIIQYISKKQIQKLLNSILKFCNKGTQQQKYHKLNSINLVLKIVIQKIRENKINQAHIINSKDFLKYYFQLPVKLVNSSIFKLRKINSNNNGYIKQIMLKYSVSTFLSITKNIQNEQIQKIINSFDLESFVTKCSTNNFIVGGFIESLYLYLFKNYTCKLQIKSSFDNIIRFNIQGKNTFDNFNQKNINLQDRFKLFMMPKESKSLISFPESKQKISSIKYQFFDFIIVGAKDEEKFKIYSFDITRTQNFQSLKTKISNTIELINDIFKNYNNDSKYHSNKRINQWHHLIINSAIPIQQNIKYQYYTKISNNPNQVALVKIQTVRFQNFKISELNNNDGKKIMQFIQQLFQNPKFSKKKQEIRHHSDHYQTIYHGVQIWMLSD